MQKTTLVRIGLGSTAVALLFLTFLAYSTFFAAAQGPRIAYGETVSGEIASGVDSDTWVFDGVRGDVITIRVENTDDQFVPAITLNDPDGIAVLELAASESRPAALEFSAGLQTSGTYSATIAGASNSTGTYAFTLTLQTAGTAPDSADGVLVYGRDVSGSIDDTVFREFWSFRGTQGDVIDVRMEATSGDLDAYVALLSPQGEVIASSDTDGSSQDAALHAIRLGATGTYTVAARRSGSNMGEGGTTAGDYALSVSLRVAGSPDDLPTPVELALDRVMRGRLSADVPTALYSVEADGVLALTLNVADPSQISTIAVMTPNRALLSTVSGLSPLRTSVTLPGDNIFWIEVSAAGVHDETPIDFALIATRLTTATRASRALYYNQPQIISAGAPLPENWHFQGRRGDLVTLDLSPFGQVLDGTLQILAPDGTMLVQRRIRRALSQSLLLESEGQYEIVFLPAALSTGYQIGVRRDGVAGLAFEQHARPQSSFTFPNTPNNAVEGALQPFSTDAWILDVTDAQVWRFALNATNTNLPLVLAVEAPDGTWLEHAVSDRLTRTAWVQTLLPQAGRYRVLALELSGSESASYTLSGSPAEGGELAANVPQKGVLTPGKTYDLWDIRTAPGKLINVRIGTDAPGVILPKVHIIGPDGAVAGSTTQTEYVADTTTFSAFAATGGVYRILVQQAPLSQRVAYHITANVMTPFEVIDTPAGPVSTATHNVFVTEKTPAPQPRQVVIPAMIAPQIAPDSPILEDARRVENGTLIRGEIAPEARFQAWTFSANAEQLLEFSVIALEDNSGPDLSILGPSGDIITERFVSSTTTNYLTHRFVSGGTYTLLVKLDNGGAYTLWIDPLNRIDDNVPNVVPGRAIAYGKTLSDQLLSRDDVRPFVFFGQAGDVIAAHATATDAALQLELDLQAVGMGTLSRVQAEPDSRVVRLDAVTLPQTGLYQIVVSATSGGTVSRGTFTLHLNIASTTENTRAGGVLDKSQTGYLASPETSQTWLFAAQAGERVTLQVEPLSNGAPAPLTVQLTDSGGRVFLQHTSSLGAGILTVDSVLLPRSGVYQALVSGGQRDAGLYRITLDRDARGVQDAERSIRYGESAGKVMTPENFLDVWTFAGSRGDIVSLTARRVRGDKTPLTVQVRSDTGQVLTTVATDDAGVVAHIERLSLPVTGHYSIVIGNPEIGFEGDMAYEVTLLLRGTTARSSGTTLAYGDTVEGAFYVDDPADAWVFEGQQGDFVTAWLSSDTPELVPTLSLLSTDWHAASASGQRQVLASAQADATGIAQLSFVLPTSGTYAFVVHDTQHTGGRYTLQAVNENPPTGPALPLRVGQPREGQVAGSELVDAWRFEGASGSEITITVTPDSRTSLITRVTLLSPDGTVLAQTDAEPRTPATITRYRLPYEGAYTVQVTRTLVEAGRTEGRYTVSIEQNTPSNLTYPAIPFGNVQRGTLDNGSPSTYWSFDGQAGDAVRVRMEVTGGTLDPVVRMYDPAGMLLLETSGNAANNVDVFASLPASGRYIVEARRYHGVWGTTSGSFALSVERAYQTSATPIEPAIAYGDRIAGTTSSNNRSDFWPFKGLAGDVIFAKIQFPVDDAPLVLVLRDAAGNTLVTGQRDLGDVIINDYTLPTDAVYTLEVRRPGDAAARFSPYTLDLSLLAVQTPVPAPSSGLLTINESVTTHFGDGVQSHTWLFAAQANEAVSLSLVPIYAPLAVDIAVLSPDGTPLFSDRVTERVGTYATGTLVLPVQGVYVITIRSENSTPGAGYRLALYPQTTTRLEDTIPVGETRFGTLNDAEPAQRWRFTAGAGVKLSLVASRTSGNLQPTLTVLDPNNYPLIEGYRTGEVQTSAQFTVPEAGDYTIVIGRQGGLSGTTSGGYTLLLRQHTISAHAAVAQVIELDRAQTGFIDGSTPHLYAFEAQEGDSIAVSVQALSGAEAPPALTLETESGDVLPLPLSMTETEVAIASLWAPYTGRYVAVLSSDATVHYQFAAHRRLETPALNGTVRTLVAGPAFIEGINNPGMPTFWTFSGGQGDVLSFVVDTTDSMLRADITLFGPQGFVANAVEAPTEQEVTLGPVRLPDDGEYVLVIEAWMGPAGDTSGRFSVRAERAEPGVSGSDGGHILAFRRRVVGGLIPEDREDRWTFAGHAGQSVTIRAEHTTTDSTVSLELLDPNGNSVGTSVLATAYEGAEIQDIELSTSGLFSVRISAQFADDVPIEYQLAVFASENGLLASIEQAQGLAFGASETGVLGNPRTYAAWTFYGQAGQQIELEVSPEDAGFAPEVYLLDPAGTMLKVTTAQAAGAPARIEGYQLATNGFYAVMVGHSTHSETQDSAAYTITLEQAAAGATHIGVLGSESREAVLTLSTMIHTWEIQPEHSGTYLVHVQSPALTPPNLYLVSGSEKQVAVGENTNSGQVDAVAWLYAGSNYAAVVSNGVTFTHTAYQIQLLPASVRTGGSDLIASLPEIGRITTSHFTDEWRFQGQTGETVSIDVQRVSRDLRPLVSLFDANGLLLREALAGEDGTVNFTVELPADGEYSIAVTRAEMSAGTTEGDYTIRLERVETEQ